MDQATLEAALKEIHEELVEIRNAYLAEGKAEAAEKIKAAGIPICDLLVKILAEGNPEFILEGGGETIGR